MELQLFILVNCFLIGVILLLFIRRSVIAGVTGVLLSIYLALQAASGSITSNGVKLSLEELGYLNYIYIFTAVLSLLYTIHDFISYRGGVK